MANSTKKTIDDATVVKFGKKSTKASISMNQKSKFNSVKSLTDFPHENQVEITVNKNLINYTESSTDRFKKCSSFNFDGSYFVTISNNITSTLSTLDHRDRHHESNSRIKVWETCSGSVMRDFELKKFTSDDNTSNENEIFIPSCISWMNFYQSNTSIQFDKEKNSKKKKKSISNVQEKNEFLIIGSVDGQIFVYDFKRAEIVKTLTSGGHLSEVTGICSGLAGNECLIFTCSKDNHVIIWNLEEEKILKKINPLNKSLECIAFLPLINKNETEEDSTNAVTSESDNESILLVASSPTHSLSMLRSSNLKLINSEERSKDLIFHAFPIEKIVVEKEGQFFCSIAQNDRVLQYGMLKNNLTSKTIDKKDSIVYDSITLDEACIDCVIMSAEDGLLVLVVLLRDGSLSLIKFGLDKKIIKKIKILYKSVKNSSIPIISIGNSLNFLMTCRGNFVNPVFEKLSLSSIFSESKSDVDNSTIILERSDFYVPLTFKGSSSVDQTDKSKETVGIISAKSIQSIGIADQIGQVKKESEIHRVDGVTVLANNKMTESSFEDRLKILSLEKSTATAAKGKFIDQNTGSSLTKVLSQALQSNDGQLLEKVLNVEDLEVIEKTIKNLPVQFVSIFLKVLIVKFQSRPPMNAVKVLIWLKALIKIHLSYLLGTNNIFDENIRLLYQSIESRVANFNEILNLNGKMEILMTQISLRDESLNQSNEFDSTATNSIMKPLLVIEGDGSVEQATDIDDQMDVMNNTGSENEEESEFEEILTSDSFNSAEEYSEEKSDLSNEDLSEENSHQNSDEENEE